MRHEETFATLDIRYKHMCVTADMGESRFRCTFLYPIIRYIWVCHIDARLT